MTADREAARAVALCQELVRIESPSGGEGAVAARVAAALRECGYDAVERDALGSVVGIRRGPPGGPRLLLDAHLDVVPATEPERWRYGPFSGERAEGRIWGRGATDVKGSLAAMIVGVGALPAARLGGDVILSASIGEECMEGCALGRILDAHPVDRVLIGEPTGLAIGLGHKGRASLVVEAAGRAAHTSHPERGVNAVYRMVEAIPLLRRLPLPDDALLGRGVMELVEVSSEPFPGSSMVPFRCRARFDRRLVRGESRAGVLAEVREAVGALEGLSVRYHQNALTCYTGAVIEEEVFHPCYALQPADPVAQAAQEALRAAGQEGAFFYAPFCTNGSCSAGARGLPTLIYGAGRIDDAHVRDEGIDERELVAAVAGYGALAEALTR